LGAFLQVADFAGAAKLGKQQRNTAFESFIPPCARPNQVALFVTADAKEPPKFWGRAAAD
jgi:hypothetical protein